MRGAGRLLLPALTLLVAVVLLLGCATPSPPQEPRDRVVPGPAVPVPVPCKLDPKTAAQRPDFADKDQQLAAIPDVYAGAGRYRAAIAQYRFWVRTLEAALTACAKEPGG